MKKQIFLTAAFLIVAFCLAGCGTLGVDEAVINTEKANVQGYYPEMHVFRKNTARSLSYEEQADRLYARLSKTADMDTAIKLAGSAVELYKKAVDADSSREILVHKYCMAIGFKYNLLIPDTEQNDEKKKVYAEVLAMLERLYTDDNVSIYAAYDLTYLLALNVQYYSLFQAIGAVNRIYRLCEKVYAQDRVFENYSAPIVLGRIHCVTPNIIFLLTWPDKKMARQYLEEALSAAPDSLLAKYYLADTLHAIGEKDMARDVFDGVIETNPRKGRDYFQNLKIRNICVLRKQELRL